MKNNEKYIKYIYIYIYIYKEKKKEIDYELLLALFAS